VEDLDAREAEDLQVSHYYATTGNFLASYMRAQDAVKTIPDDPLAHFALAESASKLKKTDEAIAEYKLYLKLDPDGEKAKAAQRALADMVPK
jgi:Tfp pilus assembly protein PilF